VNSGRAAVSATLRAADGTRRKDAGADVARTSCHADERTLGSAMLNARAKKTLRRGGPRVGSLSRATLRPKGGETGCSRKDRCRGWFRPRGDEAACLIGSVPGGQRGGYWAEGAIHGQETERWTTNRRR